MATPTLGSTDSIQSASSIPSSQIQDSPPETLFLPENRKRLLDHLLQVSLPQIRSLVGIALERGYFLLEPMDLTIASIRKMIVEADEYRLEQSFWGWAKEQIALAIHESVLGVSEEDERGDAVREEVFRDCDLRGQFNCLPLEQRRALYLLFVKRLSISKAAYELKEEESTFRQQAKAGFEKLNQYCESEEKGGSAYVAR